MPRGRLPPTPASSTEPIAQDKKTVMESAFSLPPAAMNRSPPTSPVIQRKRTLSGSAKKEDLPPPPSRARKIIQMKPKEETATLATTSTKTTSPRRKQPSATSAAGRKIARKTAHSIIERRRRSKMNEEFGVLKDMIPACKGVEMHKLAILQAGIEYVKYLQGCIDKLQNERGTINILPQRMQRHQHELDEDMEEQEPTDLLPSPQASSGEVKYRRGSTVTTATSASTYASPVLKPNMSSSSLTSQRQLPLPKTTLSTSPPPLLAQTPTPTGISPAFNAIHFSPDLSRTYTSQAGKPSPNILPLPQSAMPMSAGNTHQEGAAEATATAALMMLTNDRRGNKTKGGMSVRDLLSY